MPISVIYTALHRQSRHTTNCTGKRRNRWIHIIFTDHDQRNCVMAHTAS
jgi:hypothetical protein